MADADPSRVVRPQVLPVTRRAWLRGAAALGLTSGLGACASLTGGGAVPTYDLTAVREFPRYAGGARGQLVVADPSALAVLDTDKIMVRPAPGQIAQLAGGQWSDRLPRLLQSRIVQSFENANRLRRVGRPGERMTADYQLIIDVRAFNVVVGPEPAAEVELSVKIVADRSGRVISGRVFRATIPAPATDGPEAVRAIDTAFGQVATELVLWTSRVV